MRVIQLGIIASALVSMSATCARPDGDSAPAPSPASIDSVLTVAGRRVPPALINRYVAQRLGFTSRGGEVRCAYAPLGVASDRVFVNTLCLELVRDGDTLSVGSGRGGPVALRIAAEGDSVRVLSHEAPADGGGHAASIRRIFPPEVAERLVDPTNQHTPHGGLELYLRGEAAARLGLRP